jgi:branched-chain amino acid transport system permease protein
MKVSGRVRAGLFLSLIILLLLVPIPANGYVVRLLTTFFAFAVMASAWNLIGGFAGYADFGNVVFYGIGGYATALLMSKAHVPFAPAFIAGGLLCALFATLVGLPVLRLRGHYFAIATLGISQAVREVIANWPSLTGGGTGVSLPIADFDNAVFYYIMFALLVIVVAAAWWVSRNRFGYGLVAIRENEQAAQVMGVNALRYKVAAYALAGLFIGMVGGVHAYWFTFIDPGTIFDVGISVQVIIMAVLGGAGTIRGPIAGALILTVIGEILNAYLPNVHLTALGIIIIAVVLLIPRGLDELLPSRGKLPFGSIRARLAQTRV